MEFYYEPKQIFNILIRWWWLLVIGIVLAVSAGYWISQKQTPVYEATTTIMVGGFIQTPQISRDDIYARDALTQAYAEMALRQPVLDGVVKALDLNVSWRQLKDNVFVNVVESTPMIEITAEANSPQDAEILTGEIVNQLILLNKTQEDTASNRQFVQQEIDNLQTRIEKGRERLEVLQTQVTSPIPPEALAELKVEIDTLQRFITDWEVTYSQLLHLMETNVSLNTLSIIEEAHAKPEPVSPDLTLNILFSACIGFGLALVAVFLLDLLDDRIKTGESLEKDLGMSHLGSINKMKGKNYDGKLISTENSFFGTASRYRKILNNIGFVNKGDRPVRSLLVTSPRLREGKSVTASNLGIMLAQAGFRTVIVDVDWIKPVQHLLFSLSNNTGLMNLLAAPDLLTKEQLQLTGIPNLKILTIGTLPENPVKLLEPTRMKKILSDLSRLSNVIILDAPSTSIAESAILYGLVEGVILVIDSNLTKIDSVKKSMTSLYLTGGKLLGGVLNRSHTYWRVS
jgi:non-specific protein-tyrosine kinase